MHRRDFFNAGWNRMLQTLKIAKTVAAVAVICFIAYLVFFGLRPDEATVATLEKPSAVSKFRKLSDLLSRTQNKESEFVKQAKAFALRINPPPPLVIEKPVIEKPVAKGPVKPSRPTPKQQTRTTKFSLVATCRYEDKPEKSLALLNIVAEGLKWIRQGDTVGHLTVHKVNDGSIILYQNGTLNAEIFVPPLKETVSLLKSDYENGDVAESETAEQEKPALVYEAITNAPANRGSTLTNRRSAARTAPGISRARALRPGIPQPPKTVVHREATPEEQKQANQVNKAKTKGVEK